MTNLKIFFRNLTKCNKRFISGTKRKYPIDPNHVKELPVFQYPVSKKSYRRIFSWGNIQTGALGVAYFRQNEDIGKVHYLKYPKRIRFGEKFEVTTAACGFGFTAFAVNSDTDIKVYGTGINNDSQIGYHAVKKDHPLGILYQPRPIHLPFSNPEKTKIRKLSAGRAHLVVLTDEGIFTLGNNAYGQCGRKIIEDENYSKSNFVNYIEKIDGKQILDIECGQDHSLVLTEDGSVYSCGWGADGQTGLGHFNNTSKFTKLNGDIQNEKITKLACRSDFVLALNDKGEVFGWGNTEYGQITLQNDNQQLSNPTHLAMLTKLGKVKSIASAGTFCVVVNENGEVFSWGYGLLGVGPKVQESKSPLKIPETLFGKNDFQPDNTVEKVVCGLNYTAAVTSLGDLYIWGGNKSCCLGLGTEKDQYFPLKVSLGGSVDDVFCGIDHTVTICKPFI